MRLIGKKQGILFVLLFLVLCTVVCLSGAVVVWADFVNVPGSTLDYTKTDDGGINVTMKASDNWNLSPDRLIWDQVFSVDETIDAYVGPENYNNGALHYLVVRLADQGSDANTYVYELHVGNQGTGNFNLRSSVGIWADFAAPLTNIAHLTFRIGDNGLEVIYEGNVIETISSFTAANFPNGIEISFRAYAEAMWGGSGENLTSYIRVGNPKTIDKEKAFYLSADENVAYSIDLNGAKATDVTLQRDGGEAVSLDTGYYTVTDDLLTLIAEGLKKVITEEGYYTITVVNPAMDITLCLRVSRFENIQPERTEYAYDIYSGEDLSITVWANKDTYLRLLDENNLEVEAAYDLQTNTLKLSASYLQGLSVGVHSYRIISEMSSEGVNFSVNISNSAPPVCVDENLVFDLHKPQDLFFRISIFENETVWVEGEGIQKDDFFVENDGVTIFSQFFAQFEPKTVTLSLCGDNGKTSFNITIIDTEPAELISEDLVRINILSVSDAIFTFDMKYDEISLITGHNITGDNWKQDVETGELVILRSYISSQLIAPNTYLFEVFTKNGGEFQLTIVTEETVPPEIEGEQSVSFRKDAPASVAFQVLLNNSEFIGISGSNITETDYTVDVQDGVLNIVFSETFLLGLTNGNHSFALRFTQGELLAEVMVSNKNKPEFENGKEILVVETDDDDLTVGLISHYGVLLSVDETIDAAHYVYDSEKEELTIFSEFLQDLDKSVELTFVFDNGSVTLIVERAYVANVLETYDPMWVSGTPDNSVRLSGLEDGWVNVEYLHPVSGAYGGGVRMLTPFRADYPIEIYVDFGSVPDLAGTSFAITLSSEMHKMHYGENPSELFGNFVVGESFLQAAYFGIPGIHDALDQQISHELLRRAESGYETFTFDIGETNTKIYLNGRLIREVTDVTRDQFANGDVFVLFTPLFWHDQAGTDFKIKTNATAQVEELSCCLNTKVMNSIKLHANICGLFEGIALFDGEQEITISSFDYKKDNTTGEAEIEIPAVSILYRRGFALEKDYMIRIKTSAGNIDVPLVFSNAEYLEIISPNLYFDLLNLNDLTIHYMENFDVFMQIEGGGITVDDYKAENGILTIYRSFLTQFPIGKVEFTIYSNLKPEGQSFEIAIVNSSSVQIDKKERVFDLNNEEDVVIGITTIIPGHVLSLHGYDIEEDDWRLDGQNLIIEKDFLAALPVGDYTFELHDEWLTGKYNSIDVEVSVINSLAPTFADGNNEQNIDYIIGTNNDIIIRLNANKGIFMEAIGGYLTADLYDYDATTGTFTLYKEWLEILEKDAFDIELRFDNGVITLHLSIQEKPADVVANNDTGCGGIISDQYMVLSGILLFAVVVLFAKKSQFKKEKM